MPLTRGAFRRRRFRAVRQTLGWARTYALSFVLEITGCEVASIAEVSSIVIRWTGSFGTEHRPCNAMFVSGPGIIRYFGNMPVGMPRVEALSLLKDLAKEIRQNTGCSVGIHFVE